MENMPLVTCIIPCYKKFGFLFEAIQSVLKQDYPNIELLISDDASEGFPQKKVERFVSAHAKCNIINWNVHHNEQNIGLVRNINKMIDIGKGEYYMILAGDDLFYDGTVVSKVVERFISTGVDLIACSRLQCTEALVPIRFLPTEKEKKKIRKLNTAQKQFESFAVFRFLDMASGSALYFSRKNIEKMGSYDESYRNWEDGPRLAAYVKRGMPLYTAHDIVAVKYRNGGVSNNPLGNQLSFSYIGKDREHYIDMFTTCRPNRYWLTRRKFLFWRKWDQCMNAKQRMCLMASFPEWGIMIAWRKLLRKPIRST